MKHRVPMQLTENKSEVPPGFPIFFFLIYRIILFSSLRETAFNDTIAFKFLSQTYLSFSLWIPFTSTSLYFEEMVTNFQSMASGNQ